MRMVVLVMMAVMVVVLGAKLCSTLDDSHRLPQSDWSYLQPLEGLLLFA